MGERRDDFGEMPEVGEAIRRADRGARWPTSEASQQGPGDYVQDPSPQPSPQAPPAQPAPATGTPPCRSAPKRSGRNAPSYLAILGIVAAALGVGGLMTAQTAPQFPAGVEQQWSESVNVPVERDTLELRLPATSVSIETFQASEVSVISLDAENCDAVLLPGAKQQVEVSCPMIPMNDRIVVTVPEDIDLTVSGGTDVQMTGRLGVVTLTDATTDVLLLEVDARSLRGSVQRDIGGEVARARDVALTSRDGRIDLTLERLPASTTLKAPEGDVALVVPRNAKVATAFTSKHAAVTSDVANTRGAPTKLTVDAGYGISVTTSADDR